MARKLTILISLLIAFVIAGGGCYTIIKHPKVDLVEHDNQYYHKQCLDCHQDYHEFPYGYGYRDVPSYWQDYGRWGSYYTYPWWWENYWWDIGGGESEAKYKYDTGEKPNERRGLFENLPWEQGLGPAPIVPDAGSGSSANTGGTSTGSSDDDDGKKKEDAQKTEKQENTKPERRRLPEKEKK
jgi:hypothetical protein